MKHDQMIVLENKFDVFQVKGKTLQTENQDNFT